MHELNDQELEQVVGGVEVGGSTSTSNGQTNGYLNGTLPGILSGPEHVGSRVPTIDDWFDLYWLTHSGRP